MLFSSLLCWWFFRCLCLLPILFRVYGRCVLVQSIICAVYCSASTSAITSKFQSLYVVNIVVFACGVTKQSVCCAVYRMCSVSGASKGASTPLWTSCGATKQTCACAARFEEIESRYIYFVIHIFYISRFYKTCVSTYEESVLFWQCEWTSV